MEGRLKTQYGSAEITRREATISWYRTRDEKTNGEGHLHHSIQGRGRVERQPSRVINQMLVYVEVGSGGK